VTSILEKPSNRPLLEYVAWDSFGAHVFPGNIQDYPPDRFLADLDRHLEDGLEFHLWSYLPLCHYRCHFCQYPVVVVKRGEGLRTTAETWVDANIREAALWLDSLPRLRSTPVGEFNLFGGTPTVLPQAELKRLLEFYRESFAFTPETTIRVEETPDSLTDEMLAFLADHGCAKISFGIQSFDADVLRLSGRGHSAQDVLRVTKKAQQLGYERINGDLIYGMAGQTVESFERDIDMIASLGFTAVNISKLHLRPFAEAGTAVSGVPPAAWQIDGYRSRIGLAGARWPNLGEQYQMREVAVSRLQSAGFY